MADDRPYIKVHHGMPEHPKVEALSDKAFRLLVERWCWCSRNTTDGRIPRAVWQKSGTPKARRELVDAGLVEVFEDRVMMHDYLEHQRSAAEIAEIVQAKRRAGVLGNHNRWHVPHGKYDPNCPICVTNGSQMRSQSDQEVDHESNISDANEPPGIESGSDQSASLGTSQVRQVKQPGTAGMPKRDSEAGSQMRSQERSQPESRSDRKASPTTEAETDLSGVTSGGGGYVGQRARDDPPPPRCLQHRDNPAAGPCGPCGDARRVRAAWDAEQTLRHAAARSAEARRAAELRAVAAMNCDLCDDHGYSGKALCDHDPNRLTRVARGRAAVQAALDKRKDPA